MSEDLQYTVIEGIKCFNPEVASAYADYPDSGFDLTDRRGESSFWVRSRNRSFRRIIFNNLVLIWREYREKREIFNPGS